MWRATHAATTRGISTTVVHLTRFRVVLPRIASHIGPRPALTLCTTLHIHSLYTFQNPMLDISFIVDLEYLHWHCKVEQCFPFYTPRSSLSHKIYEYEDQICFGSQTTVTTVVPFVQAECCEDQVHCCPEGTHCDVDTSSCINATASVPWVEGTSSIAMVSKVRSQCNLNTIIKTHQCLNNAMSQFTPIHLICMSLHM